MSTNTGEFERHDYSAVDQHFDELNRRAGTRTGWLRAATFWSYARSISLITVAGGLAACLVLLGCSFLLEDPKAAGPVTVAMIPPAPAGGFAYVEPLPPVSSRPQEHPGTSLKTPELRSEIEQPPSERGAPETSEGREDTTTSDIGPHDHDPGIPIVYNFTLFSQEESDVPGFESVITGKGFESSTSTTPSGQWCYTLRGTSPVTQRIDLGHLFGERLVEPEFSAPQRSKLGLTPAGLRKLRSLCDFPEAGSAGSRRQQRRAGSEYEA